MAFDTSTPGFLDEVITSLEHVEARQRRLDAERLRLFARAVAHATTLPETVLRCADNTADTDHAAGTVASAGTSTGPGTTGRAAEFHAREIAYRSLRAELALALGQSEHTTERLMSLATSLTDRFPATLASLDAGKVSLRHARVIMDAGDVIGAGCNPETLARCRGYESAVLPVAATTTPARLRPRARELAEAWAERSLEERHLAARSRRRVWVVPREDGMADVGAHLPAVEAYAIVDRVTRLARACERGERVVPTHAGPAEEGEDVAVPVNPAVKLDSAVKSDSEAGMADTRTRDQMRADAFTELLLAGDEWGLFAGSTLEAIRAQIQVTVYADGRGGRLDGRHEHLDDSGERPDATGGRAKSSGEHPDDLGEHSTGKRVEGLVLRAASVPGYGPIDTATAGGVAAGVPVWDRVMIDPGSGEVRSVDRYRPSEEMRRLLAVRDGRCRFPGCIMPMYRCDLDHTVDAAKGGPTSCDNLAYLCRGHHVVKHHAGWRVVQGPGGVLWWTSPTGREYADEPPSHWLPPHLPPNSASSNSASSNSPPPNASSTRHATKRGTRVRFATAPECTEKSRATETTSTDLRELQ